MTGTNTTKPYTPKPIVSVRPTKDGQWAVVETSHDENREWRKDWGAFWESDGKRLQEENPGWWAK